jgi:hypothetical protein
MNPYASFLAGRNPVEVIGGTADRLSVLMKDLGPQGADRSPGPGKRTAREIVSHLADTELVFAYRLRQARAEAHHVIQPFDQDRWATSYGAYDAESAREVFSVVRRWNVRLIASLSEAELAKRVTHPERGEMSVQTIVETMAGHDRNHLVQLEALAGRR